MKSILIIFALATLSACGDGFKANGEKIVIPDAINDSAPATTGPWVYDAQNRRIGKHLVIDGHDVIRLRNSTAQVRVNLDTGQIFNGLINGPEDQAFCYYASSDCSGNCLLNGTSKGNFGFYGIRPGMFHAQGYYSTSDLNLTAQSRYDDVTASCEPENLTSTFREIHFWDYFWIIIGEETVFTQFDAPMRVQ